MSKSIAELEMVITPWFLVRVTRKDGSTGYLGHDALGGYFADDLRNADFFKRNDETKAKIDGTVKWAQNRGDTVQWCRVTIQCHPTGGEYEIT